MDEPTLSEHEGIRYLHFNTEWIQGAMEIAEPAKLVLEYAAQMMAWLLFVPPPREPQAIGVLGLGAGSLARFCLKHTDSTVIAVERNPAVTAICQTWFKLPQSNRMWIAHEDAAHWVSDPVQRGLCPVLMVDLYDAQAQGPVCDSVEFYRDCRAVLGERGVMVVNLFGNHDSFPRNMANIEAAFEDGIALVLPEIDAGNRIVLAFRGMSPQVDAQLLLARAEEVERQYGLPARKWARSWLGLTRDVQA
ncbi:MAG: spermidine synthase [Corticimicrobacter sp.]|uniref:spermidine synthase n=1 Tax=Corticimicrobacter sp. TaxID=2678536 RepID=UPI0032DA5501